MTIFANNKEKIKSEIKQEILKYYLILDAEILDDLCEILYTHFLVKHHNSMTTFGNGIRSIYEKILKGMLNDNSFSGSHSEKIEQLYKNNTINYVVSKKMLNFWRESSIQSHKITKINTVSLFGLFMDILSYKETGKISENKASKILINIDSHFKELTKELGNNEKIVEIIKEVPIEVVKEIPVEIIKEIEVEKIVEIIKEVPIEVVKEIPVEIIKEVEVVKEVEIANKSPNLSIAQMIEVLQKIPTSEISKLSSGDLSNDEKIQNIIKGSFEETENNITNPNDEIQRIMVTPNKKFLWTQWLFNTEKVFSKNGRWYLKEEWIDVFKNKSSFNKISYKNFCLLTERQRYDSKFLIAMNLIGSIENIGDSMSGFPFDKFEKAMTMVREKISDNKEFNFFPDFEWRTEVSSLMMPKQNIIYDGEIVHFIFLIAKGKTIDINNNKFDKIKYIDQPISFVKTKMGKGKLKIHFFSHEEYENIEMMISPVDINITSESGSIYDKTNIILEIVEDLQKGELPRVMFTNWMEKYEN